MIISGNVNANCLSTIRVLCPRSPPKSLHSYVRVGSFPSRLRRAYFCTSKPRNDATTVSIPKTRASSKPSSASRRRNSHNQWNEHQDENIVSGDLHATLEAHRASSGQPIYRYVYSEDPNKSKTHDDSTIASNSHHVGKRGITLAEFHASVPRSSLQLVSNSHDDKSRGTDVSTITSSTTIFASGYSIQDPPFGLPWETEDSLNMSDPHQRLNTEICNFAQWALPTKEEQKFFELAAFQECYYMNAAFPELHFDLVGSQRTGLATATSDIDMAFVIKNFQMNKTLRGPSTSLAAPKVKRAVRQKLNAIRRVLGESGRFENLEVVKRARIPLVQARYQDVDVDFQFVYSNDWPGSNEFFQNYLDLYPQLLPIYVLLKGALESQGLLNTQKGGIGSYPLFLMILASFRISGVSTNTGDIVQSLMTFLSFYRDFDALSQCISVQPATLFKKRIRKARVKKPILRERKRQSALAAQIEMSYHAPRSDQQLVLQDPNNIEHNATHSCKSFVELKTTLCQIQAVFQRWLDQGSSAKGEPVVHPLEWMLSNAVYSINEKRSTLKRWQKSDKGKAQMEAMEKFYNEKVDLGSVAHGPDSTM